MLLIVLVTDSKSQCKCSEAFNYISKYLLDNSASAASLTQKEQKRLAGLSDSLANVINGRQVAEECPLYIKYMVSQLRDHHTEVSEQLPDLARKKLKDKSGLENYLKEERTGIPQLAGFNGEKIAQQLKDADIDAVEGIYNAAYVTVAVTRVKSAKDSFIGVVLSSVDPILQPGMVILELKGTGYYSYNTLYRLPGFTRKVLYLNMEVKGGKMPEIGFAKQRAGAADALFAFTKLDDSTCYLKLRSFGAEYSSKIDSIYTAVDTFITKSSYLIIDIRGNGGGSEQLYLPLLNWMYTRPMYPDTAEVWVTKENIAQYERALTAMLEDSASYGPQAVLHNRDLLNIMKAAPLNSFAPITRYAPEPYVSATTSTYPKKIALLYDRYTASAAEGLIYMARQSDKVVTMGTNSGGYMGFGNVMKNYNTNGCYQINYTTIRYRNYRRYEHVGIPPAYQLKPGTDWIKGAVNRLKAR